MDASGRSPSRAAPEACTTLGFRPHRGVALAGARSTAEHRAARHEPGGLNEYLASAEPVCACTRRAPHSGLFRILSTQDRGDGTHTVGIDYAVGAAAALFRLRDLWRGRLHP